MAKKQTIIKKPVGNGNISITIENNLKNTNQVPPQVVAKKRRRRNKPPTETENLQPPLPPLKDVSYIKPGPSNSFTVWRDNFNDSYNTTIPQGQAQQMGLLRTLPTPALTNQQQAPPITSTEQQSTRTIPERYDPINISDEGSYSISSLHNDPINISDDGSSSISSLHTRPETETESWNLREIFDYEPSISSHTRPEQQSFRAPAANYDPRNISDDESSISSLHTRPETESNYSVRQLMNLMAGKGQFYAYGNNLHYDPYHPNESMEDRYTDRSSHNQPPLTVEEQDDEKKQDDEEEPANKTVAMEEIAKAVPGISVENAGHMFASEEGVTTKEAQDFYKGKQSIIITAKSRKR